MKDDLTPYFNVRLSLTNTLFAFVFVICHLPKPSIGQDVSFWLDEQLVIGDNERADAEYLFAGPRRVVTGDQGNIYVVDQKRPEIRVFSKSGEYIKTIGREGRGPGEFVQISGLTFHKRTDELIVADNSNQRFTLFSNGGKSLETVTYPSEGLEVVELFSFGQSHLITAVDRSRMAGFGDPVPLIHELSEDLRTIVRSMAWTDTWWDLAEPFSQVQQRWGRISAAHVSENSFLIAPEFYRGTIYWYRRRGDGWECQTLQGRKTKRPPYRLYKPDALERAPNPKRVISGRVGQFVVSIKRVERGVIYT